MKQKIQLKTPITYWGGKQKMLDYILPLIPEHRIYTEAFFGGGAVFWAKEPAKVEFINDKNAEVINFYRVLKQDFAKLKREIDVTLHSEFQQKQAKAIYLDSTGHSEVKRAWAVWALSHQSFYSILTNSWKCSKSRAMGSQIQTRKESFTDIYSKRLERTSVFCRDALEIIRKTDHEDAFHYIDPPYFNADMGHYGGYTINNFESLLQLLTAIRGKFMLSSYPSDILTDYAEKAKWKMIELNLPRSGGGGRKVEVLTVNYGVDYIDQRYSLVA
jgi:DNA adenine methylase